MSITYATDVAFIRLNSKESGNCRKCLSEINTKILRTIIETETNTKKRSLKFVFQAINDSILHSLSDIFKSLTYVLIRFTTFERHCSFSS